MRMSNLQTFDVQQRLFGEALLDADLPVPEGVVGPDGQPSLRRFNVYRNNVVAGQIATLSEAYPAITTLVGDVFFKVIARDYVLTHPSTTPMMFDYGADFPAFIDSFPAVDELPYLGDVARIERAWIEAYHSPDALPLSGIELRDALACSDLRLLTFQLNPSTRVLRSPFPALSIWEMNTGSNRDRTIDLDEGPEECVVVRPDANVQLHRLPEGGAAFLATLAKGFSLVDAAEHAFADKASFDLVSNIAALIDSRVVVGASVIQRNIGPDEA
jgi:hypothetical protein